MGLISRVSSRTYRPSRHTPKMQTIGLRNARGVSTVLGTMEMGRRASLEESQKMIEYFKEKKYLELDTAALYSGGQTEEYLGQMPKETWRDECRMATKINTWGKNNFTAASVKKQTADCYARMQTESCDIMYLHLPDHKTQLKETLKAMNDLHKQGKFKELPEQFLCVAGDRSREHL